MNRKFGKAAIKKPVQIDYFEWDQNPFNLFNWVESFKQDAIDYFFFDETENILKVKTLEGSSYSVPNGYIIIRGVRGEYYPCEPSIFKETYDII